MCLSAAEVYSVKVIQRQRRSLQEDDVDKSHYLRSVVSLQKQEKNASVLWDSAECVAYNST